MLTFTLIWIISIGTPAQSEIIITGYESLESCNNDLISAELKKTPDEFFSSMGFCEKSIDINITE